MIDLKFYREEPIKKSNAPFAISQGSREYYARATCAWPTRICPGERLREFWVHLLVSASRVGEDE
jgi:hypothetical protein